MNLNSIDLGDFIDLERYPVHQLDSEQGRALIGRCQKMMAAETICVLPGFLRQELVDKLVMEITGLQKEVRKVDYLSTIYGWMNNEGFDNSHPRSQLLRRHCGVITTEQLDPEGFCCCFSNNFKTGPDNGTRCITWAFMRFAGIVQILCPPRRQYCALQLKVFSGHCMGQRPLYPYSCTLLNFFIL